jgi:excisionase family DNA binding protein
MPPSEPLSSVLHDRLIGADEVARRLHMSKRTLYRRLAQRKLPPPAERRRGTLAKWRESEIDAFIESIASKEAS